MAIGVAVVICHVVTDDINRLSRNLIPGLRVAAALADNAHRI